MRFALSLALVFAAVPVAAGDLIRPSYIAELEAISLNESTGGIYKNHALINSGMHKGTRAGGAYGLMPKTVLDILHWSRRCRTKYAFLLKLPMNQITAVLNSNAAMDADLAMTHWKRLRMTLSTERAAYAWFNGSGKVSSIPEKEIGDHWYVGKFRSALILASKKRSSMAYVKTHR